MKKETIDKLDCMHKIMRDNINPNGDCITCRTGQDCNKRPNLQRIVKAGFKYNKKYNPDLELDVYERKTGKIFYNRMNDKIVMETSYDGECKFILRK